MRASRRFMGGGRTIPLLQYCIHILRRWHFQDVSCLRHQGCRQRSLTRVIIWSFVCANEISRKSTYFFQKYGQIHYPHSQPASLAHTFGRNQPTFGWFCRSPDLLCRGCPFPFSPLNFYGCRAFNFVVQLFPSTIQRKGKILMNLWQKWASLTKYCVLHIEGNFTTSSTKCPH